ncbi:MAG: hypothetical protein HYX75_24020 [Acidobacteria bacterium]|nr:hypothetical protein [Acidobacteriota bacterium]
MLRRLVSCAAMIALVGTVGAGPLQPAPAEAEISSYKTIQPRYGESRSAQTVLIYVTEDLNRDTRIKVEDYAKTPPSQRMHVLKLNRSLHFSTGIYDYSVMTSVFSALQPGHCMGILCPAKISITASEWCGNFYEQILPDSNGARRTMHSYFEAEGDKEDYVALPGPGLYEDSLPVLIREFEGEFIPVGQKREYNILPSLWESRITHRPLASEKGSVEKTVDRLTVAGGKSQSVYKWIWHVGSRVVTYWTEQEYPHYIVRWSSSAGESGERIKTIHLPYWEHNKNEDSRLRRELGLATP